ncbi:MAG: hypothetical protein J6Y42_03870 [Bacilli bacterium]|nr:hypothetical protein [Bacilli bacterium]
MKYKNVYFFNGTAYAGKSTIVKELALKHNGIECGENYHNVLLKDLDKNEFPGLCYTRDLQDWALFIRRSPEEYEKWIDETSKECEILELRILDKLSKENKLVFVDTNISIETLHKISDKDHVLIMIASPDVSVNRFFEREDKDKQFLYSLLLKEKDVDKAMNNFKECLKRINSQERYDKFLNSGFNVLIKDENRTIEETVKLVEDILKIQ